MADRGTMRTTRLRKIQCDGCGLILRGSRGPLGDAGLPTCGCGSRMRWADISDAAIMLPERELRAEFGHELAQAETVQDRRQARRASRAYGGGAGPVGQCGGCKQLIRSTREVCSCGFHNDLHGRRNDGGYRDSGMPF